MSGSPIKIVVDTNVLFMAFYDSSSKAGRVIEYALKDKIELFAPDSVKAEIERVLKRELNLKEDEIKLLVESLPVKWIERGIYEPALSQTKVKHKSDKPVEALSLIIGCEVLSADYHFKDRMDINKLLEELENSLI